MSFIKIKHKRPYPAILPSRPELSQEGQTILITGGGAGIGYAISKAFAQAGAAKIVIVGRRLDVLKHATVKIKQEVPEFTGRLSALKCDVSDLKSTEELWNVLHAENIIIDVLVLNAAVIQTTGPLIGTDLQQIWDEFNANVRGTIDFAQRFFKQSEVNPNGHRKALINISSFSAYDFEVPGFKPNYNLTKNASTLAIQQIARDVPVQKAQIISFHPGAIHTDAARAAGYTGDSLPWDDDLPGAFAVWCTSSEAQFLHGRFVWSCWDVEEMIRGEVGVKVAQDQYFLQIGVNGLEGTQPQSKAIKT